MVCNTEKMRYHVSFKYAYSHGDIMGNVTSGCNTTGILTVLQIDVIRGLFLIYSRQI